MKVIGILVEYNPLQNGHEYQIKVAKEQFGADYVILILTGNFNERGLPAIIPKKERAMWGVKAGADLVIELPACYSLADIPEMALGAIHIFQKLGVVDYMLFGSESGSLTDIEKMAKIMSMQEYQKRFDGYLVETGRPYEARKKAFHDLGYPQYAECINDPNNLLGVTFIKTLKKINCKIEPLTHKRKGQSYLDDTFLDNNNEKVYSSATAVRKMITDAYYSEGILTEKIKYSVPDYVYETMKETLNYQFPVLEMDFREEIKKKIVSCSIEELASISGMNEDIACYMKEKEGIGNFLDFDQEMRAAFPFTNFNRRYYRILTNQTKQDYETYLKNGVIFYAVVLAEGESAKPLITFIKDRSTIPLLYETDNIEISDVAKTQLENTNKADKLYYSVVEKKFRR